MESHDRVLRLDLVVIGAGTGANSVARACAAEGWSVAIVDRLPYGGTCALRGCDPKKLLVGVTEALDWAKRMKGRGLTSDGRGIDWPQMMAFSFDPDLVRIQVARTRKLGIEVRLEACVAAVERDSGGLVVVFETGEGVRRCACDMVVHGAGRVPDLDGLDLEAAGVEAGPDGIVVNRFMRSVSNTAVFAAGDCAGTGAPKLTPVSAIEARVAFKNLLAGKDTREVEYPPIPTVVFTVPPVAGVGKLESEARAEGIDVTVHHRSTEGWYSSLRVAESHTAYKVLVEKDTGRIIGAHVIGPGAEEQVNLFAMAMGVNMTANELKGVVFAYPSFASDLASMVSGP